MTPPRVMVDWNRPILSDVCPGLTLFLRHDELADKDWPAWAGHLAVMSMPTPSSTAPQEPQP